MISPDTPDVTVTLLDSATENDSSTVATFAEGVEAADAIAGVSGAEAVDVVNAANASDVIGIAPEDFAELQRLTDHVASAPYNERYKQELIALSQRLGLVL